jgi:eukaryotic-like serine/threonine-protein kinase
VTTLSEWSAARELFEELLELDPAARERRLAEVGAADGERAETVRRLLHAHEDGELELEPPSKERLGALPALNRWSSPGSDGNAALDPMPTRLGDFEIVREIGAGGMGRVFEAMQEEPRRAVALKVMYRGLGSEHAVRRFQLEAEILARLDHPNIARIFAAGTHRPGNESVPQPWFALELVAGGRSLVAFAEEEQLDLNARLTILLEVCDGVHAGHQKGVIHRDLKGSNILVDDDRRPKIIDFGIARVAGDWDRQAGQLTFAGEIVGTLGSMSPEQLAATGGRGDADIDIRTDVYSLGALLFELLTGKPSFDLSDTSLPQAIARVRERGPRKPSSLVHGLAPELDWITLRAMSPDREDRYSTALEFAADLRRYLAREPVLAGPRTARYRAKKFIQRNRAGVAAAGLFVLSLLSALVWVSTLYVEVDEQREAATQERDKAVAINEFMGSTLFAADPAFDGPDVRVVDILDRVFVTSKALFKDQPAVRAALLDTVGYIYTSLGEFEAADRHYRESLRVFKELEGGESYDVFRVELHRGYNLIDDDRDPAAATRILRAAHAGLARTLGPDALETLRARIHLGLALSMVSENEQAEAHMRGAYETLCRLHPDEKLEQAHFAGLLGRFLQYAGDLDEAEGLLADAVAYQVAATGPGHPDALSLRNSYAGLLLALARTDEALALMEAVHADALESVGAAHPETARFANGLGQTLLGAGRFERAREVFEAAVADNTRLHGELSPLTLDSHLGLGTSLYYLDDLDRAETELRGLIVGLEATYGEADPRTQSARNNLAMILQGVGRLTDAEPLLKTNLAQRRLTSTGPNAELLGSINNLGYVLLQLERLDEAQPLLREAFEGRRTLLGEGHPSTLNSAINLAHLEQVNGDHGAAIPLLREVLRLGPSAYGGGSALLKTVEGRLQRMLEDDGN